MRAACYGREWHITRTELPTRQPGWTTHICFATYIDKMRHIGHYEPRGQSPPTVVHRQLNGHMIVD